MSEKVKVGDIVKSGGVYGRVIKVVYPTDLHPNDGVSSREQIYVDWLVGDSQEQHSL